MNYQEAKTKSIMYKCIGALIILPSCISTVISFLKLVYFRIDNGSQVGSFIAKILKKLVKLVYQQTDFLSFFWTNSPTPNHMNFYEPQNIPFILIYLAIFVGLTLWGMGMGLSRRLNKIRKKIEDQDIEDAMKGRVRRTQAEIVRSIDIPDNGLFSDAHKLYLAPIIVAVVGSVIVKVVGF